MVNNLAEDYFDGDDGLPNRKEKKPHYSDKGSHGARHNHTHQQREADKQRRRDERNGRGR